MNLKNFDHTSCQEIVTLLNELLDGESNPERESRAKELIAKNPQCRALYFTMLRTIELYKLRRNEMNTESRPIIKWMDLDLRLKKEHTDSL